MNTIYLTLASSLKYSNCFRVSTWCPCKDNDCLMPRAPYLSRRLGTFRADGIIPVNCWGGTRPSVAPKLPKKTRRK
jgi:hypothetical protein